MKEYKPTPEVGKILEWAKQEIDSVPYEVTARWVFYQVVQDYGVPKKDYRKFLKWTSKARKSFWNGWTPFLLTDDTREITSRGGGYESPQDWVDSFLRQQCVLSVQERQKHVILILYEAGAMSSQFNYYLEPLRVATAPFRGDASIRHKWEIAQRLRSLHKQYPKKPIIVLYFGDLDPKGLEIPRNALKDIWSWILSEDLRGALYLDRQLGPEVWHDMEDRFRWIRVGLNEPQIQNLDIPENPEKPGTYQWEALSDEQAGRMIVDAVRRYWNEATVRLVERDEEQATERWREMLRRRPFRIG